MTTSLGTSFLSVFAFVALRLADCAADVFGPGKMAPPENIARKNTVAIVEISFPEMQLSAFIVWNSTFPLANTSRRIFKWPASLPAASRTGYIQAYLKRWRQATTSRRAFWNCIIPAMHAGPKEKIADALSGDGWCGLHRLEPRGRTRPSRPGSDRAG